MIYSIAGAPLNNILHGNVAAVKIQESNFKLREDLFKSLKFSPMKAVLRP